MSDQWNKVYDEETVGRYCPEVHRLSQDIVRAHVYGDVASAKLTEDRLSSMDMHRQQDLVEQLGHHVQVELVRYRCLENVRDPERVTGRELRCRDEPYEWDGHLQELEQQQKEFQYADSTWNDIRTDLDIMQQGGNTVISYTHL